MRRVEFLNTNLLQRDKSTKRTEHVSPLRVQMIVARDSVFGVLAAYVMIGITLGELAVICSEARRRLRWLREVGPPKLRLLLRFPWHTTLGSERSRPA